MGKKITAYIQSLAGGGAQGVLVTVMNYYHGLGYDVTVVVESIKNDVKSRELNNGIKIVSLNVSSTKKAFAAMISYINTHETDYAFAFSPELAVNLYLIRLLTGKKFVLIGRCINTLSLEYSHSNSLFRKYISRFLVKLVYKRIDKIVVQAHNMGIDLIKNFGVPKYKIYTINNPLAVKYENIIDENKNNSRDNYILYVGRLEKQKGLNMLIKAFSNINDKSVRLKIVGKGSLKSELEHYARVLNVDARVDFEDFTDKIEHYYERALLTVMTSLFEGFPNVLIESIACGTPIVSYDLPSGPSDIIVNGVNGYLVEYLNVKDFTNKIDIALNTKWDCGIIKNSAKRFKRDNILKKYNQILNLSEEY